VLAGAATLLQAVEAARLRHRELAGLLEDALAAKAQPMDADA
jgi:hypothetical protein